MLSLIVRPLDRQRLSLGASECLTTADATRDSLDNHSMRVLFVHRNFPAHFGHIAAHLSRELGWECTFVSEVADADPSRITLVPYKPQGGATEHSHYFSRTFENAIAHAAGVHEACVSLSATFEPDLIVGHSGFGSTLLLSEVFPGVPIVNLFEYFYRPHDSDLDFRPDFPPLPEDILRSRARNAMIMLDLEQCTLGYAPTHFQRDLLPSAYAAKIDVVHDGIDTSFWRRQSDTRAIREQLGIAESDRVVTYCARGLESMRGFDIFMRAARRVCEADERARFIVVGSDTVAYGGDLRFTGGRSFREHVLDEADYDLSRFPRPRGAQCAPPGLQRESRTRVPDGALRSLVVDAERDGMQLPRGGLRHGSRSRSSHGWREQRPHRLLRRRPASPWPCVSFSTTLSDARSSLSGPARRWPVATAWRRSCRECLGSMSAQSPDLDLPPTGEH